MPTFLLWMATPLWNDLTFQLRIFDDGCREERNKDGGVLQVNTVTLLVAPGRSQRKAHLDISPPCTRRKSMDNITDLNEFLIS